MLPVILRRVVAGARRPNNVSTEMLMAPLILVSPAKEWHGNGPVAPTAPLNHLADPVSPTTQIATGVSLPRNVSTIPRPILAFVMSSVWTLAIAQPIPLAQSVSNEAKMLVPGAVLPRVVFWLMPPIRVQCWLTTVLVATTRIAKPVSLMMAVAGAQQVLNAVPFLSTLRALWRTHALFPFAKINWSALRAIKYLDANGAATLVLVNPPILSQVNAQNQDAMITVLRHPERIAMFATL